MNTLRLITDGDCPFDLPVVAKTAYEELSQKGALSLELNFVTEEEIKELNRNFRGIDKVTDVLSFPYTEVKNGEVIKAEDYEDEIEDGELLIGSVAICLKRAEEQAKEYGHSLKREVFYLALHGILHCFGFDHIEKEDEEVMTALAEKIMDKLDVKREDK